MKFLAFLFYSLFVFFSRIRINGKGVEFLARRKTRNGLPFLRWETVIPFPIFRLYVQRQDFNNVPFGLGVGASLVLGLAGVIL